MVVDTGTAILILGVFVLPGFVTLIFRERLYVVRGRESPFERLLLALFYSALIYGLLLVVAHGCGLQKHDLVEFHDGEKSLRDDLAAAGAIFVAMPGAIVISGSYWTASKNLRPWLLERFGSSDSHGVSSAWDRLFEGRSACLVRATLDDGRVVGGLYDESSFAGYGEQTQDLFISHRWDLDAENWFVRPAERSRGVWISEVSIATLEFYEPEETTGNGKTHLRKTEG